MYLRLVQFTLSEASRPKAKMMADDLVTAIKQHPGCQGATFFGDSTDGEFGLCVMWETEAAANAAAAVISPRLEAHLSGNVTAPPTRRLYPVIAA